MALLDRLRGGKAEPIQVAAVVDIDDFEKDNDDAEWQAALAGFRDHVEDLEREGRNA